MAGGLLVSVAVLVAVAVPVAVLVAVAVPVAVLVAVAVPVPVFVAVALRLVVGCSDLDGDACGVGTRLTRAGAELAVVAGRVAPSGAFECVCDVGGMIVVLVPEMPEFGPLVFDSSTATIAMTPIAAAPIPA